MRFSTGLPGLMRYPPSRYGPGKDNWEELLTADDFQQIARTADEVGYDAIAVPEHIVMPAALVPNMGAYWPDAFTVMAFLAGATRRIRVTSSVIVLPYHNPVALAKAVATLDVLSSGHVMLSFGVGMAPGEFAALGVPFERRGRVTDEYLAVMKMLWTSDEPEFHGEFVDLKDVVFEPKPLQRPHPPIWFGGNSMVSLRRAARSGDGWAPAGEQLGKGPWLERPDDLPAFMEEARRQPGFAAKESRFDISMPVAPPRIGPNHTQLDGPDGPPGAPKSTEEVIDAVGRLQDFGVTWTSIRRPGPPPGSVTEYLEGLRWAGEEVMPAFRQ